VESQIDKKINVLTVGNNTESGGGGGGGESILSSQILLFLNPNNIHYFS